MRQVKGISVERERGGKKIEGRYKLPHHNWNSCQVTWDAPTIASSRAFCALLDAFSSLGPMV
jgi:hypothetical protein